MQPREVAGPPQICALHADGGLPLQAPHSMRHPILGGHAQPPRPMVGQGLPCDPLDAPGLAECPPNRAAVLAGDAKDGFWPLLRSDDHVVSAIPPARAWVVPCSPCGFSFVWPWGSTLGATTVLFTNQRRNGSACSSLTARGGGLPIGVMPSRMVMRPASTCPLAVSVHLVCTYGL